MAPLPVPAHVAACWQYQEHTMALNGLSNASIGNEITVVTSHASQDSDNNGFRQEQSTNAPIRPSIPQRMLRGFLAICCCGSSPADARPASLGRPAIRQRTSADAASVKSTASTQGRDASGKRTSVDSNAGGVRQSMDDEVVTHADRLAVIVPKSDLAVIAGSSKIAVPVTAKTSSISSQSSTSNAVIAIETHDVVAPEDALASRQKGKTVETGWSKAGASTATADIDASFTHLEQRLKSYKTAGVELIRQTATSVVADIGAFGEGVSNELTGLADAMAKQDASLDKVAEVADVVFKEMRSNNTEIRENNSKILERGGAMLGDLSEMQKMMREFIEKQNASS